MIIKLDLDGEEYYGLLGFLQSDINFYEKRVYGLPGKKSVREQIVKVKASKTEGDEHQAHALPNHSVTLEVLEFLSGEISTKGYKTPLAVLKVMFESMDMFPEEEAVPTENDEEAVEDED